MARHSHLLLTTVWQTHLSGHSASHNRCRFPPPLGDNEQKGLQRASRVAISTLCLFAWRLAVFRSYSYQIHCKNLLQNIVSNKCQEISFYWTHNADFNPPQIVSRCQFKLHHILKTVYYDSTIDTNFRSTQRSSSGFSFTILMYFTTATSVEF